jgi:hypothetical protein
MMNVVTDFAVFMNQIVYAHVIVAHGFLIVRIFYYKYILPHVIPDELLPHWKEKRMRYHWWVPKFIMTYYVYAVFNIPFFIWYSYFNGKYWYFSHYFFIHYHMYGVAALIVTFIHHKELKLDREFFIKYPIYYILHILWSAWLMYAVVNGCDDGDWKGWMEEDLYRFNYIPLGSIDWRDKPVA